MTFHVAKKIILTHGDSIKNEKTQKENYQGRFYQTLKIANLCQIAHKLLTTILNELQL